MLIERTSAVKIVLSQLEALDPVTVFLEDFEPGKGKITISCYGQSWSSYWGGMSGDDVATFFCRCEPCYLIGNLAPQLYSTRFSGDVLVEKAKRFVLDCRRGRTAAHHPYALDKQEARSLYDRIEGQLTSIEQPNDIWHYGELLSELFGDEYHYAASEADEPNPDYEYLARIVRAVQAGLSAAKEQGQ